MHRPLIPSLSASLLVLLAFFPLATRAATPDATPQPPAATATASQTTTATASQTTTATASQTTPAAGAMPAKAYPLIPADKLAAFKANLPDTAAEIYAGQFQAMEKQGGYVVLDLRAKESFDRQHLKGSINAPLTELTEKTLPQLVPDKNTKVVLACDYSFAPTRQVPMTLQAYPVLKQAGYTKIYRLNLWDTAHNHEANAQQAPLVFEGTDVPAVPAMPPAK